MSIALPFPPCRARRHAVAGALAAASLALAACAEKTVVREVPAAAPSAAAPAVAFADGNGAGGPPPELPRVPGAIEPDAVVGAPGASVDCALTFPCRFTSEDEGFAVTLTSGDDTGLQGGLSLSFRVDTLHDTELAFGGSTETLDANGARHSAVLRALGAGNGVAPQGVSAGEAVEGRIEHAEPAAGTPLARVRIGFLDNGLVREATFANVPVGPGESPVVDCALTLPCTWASGDGEGTVELVSAGGLIDLGRLTTGFTVTTSTGSSIALAGGEALGDDGTVFAGLTHTLATERGYEPVSATTTAGLPRAGTVEFLRTATTPRSLVTLQLALYPDRPVPRWNVVFTNVPLL